MPVDYKVLTPEMREHFLEHGWVRIEQGMPPETVEWFLKDVWVRLGMDPNDKNTWISDRPDRPDIVHMPKHRLRDPADCAPKAWQAMAELLGGEDKIQRQGFGDRGWVGWSDGLIVNIGSEYWEKTDIAPQELDNWHTDGDWFRHYLDSPEQALLVVTLFSDVNSRGGATYVSEDGLDYVAKWLYERPQGTNIWLKDEDGKRAINWIISDGKKFTEMTGKKGDVILMHPLMPHSAAKNHLRNIRIISNPAASIKEPFNFDRPDGDYSLVEQKTLKAIGKPSLPGWKITGKREQFRATTATQAYKDLLVRRELQRLQEKAAKTGEKVDSVWLDEEAIKKQEGVTVDALPTQFDTSKVTNEFVNADPNARVR